MKHQQSQTVVSERVEALVKRARRVYAELEANAPDEPDVIASGISKSATSRCRSAYPEISCSENSQGS